MDLLRRTGAGELSALLGAGLLDADRRIRLHQFRQKAREALAALDAGDRALLEAYAAGVNAAAASLGARPFEYLLLGQTPEPWRAEDCMLVVYAMWIDLQGLDAHNEQRRGRLAAMLPEPVYRFLVEPEPAGEAALDGSRAAAVADADRRGVRPAQARSQPLRAPRWRTHETQCVRTRIRRARCHDRQQQLGRCRNARSAMAARWSRTTCTSACNVPNIWYRARLVVEPTGLDVAGVSLPGVPAIVAGSNRHVAWGFTNSYGDFQDLIRLERGPEADSYLTADGPRKFEAESETLQVAGGEPETLVVRQDDLGPGHRRGRRGTCACTCLDRASSGRDRHGVAPARTRARPRLAAAIIGGAGMPGQNVMIADSTAASAGCSPAGCRVRQASTPSRPSSWHEQGAGWNGWIPPAESPRLLDPPRDTRGAPTRGWWAARRMRRSATATMRRQPARARSATASRRSTKPRPPTCLRYSSMIARTMRRAGSRCSGRRWPAPAKPRRGSSSRDGAATPRSTMQAIGCCVNSSGTSRRAHSRRLPLRRSRAGRTSAGELRSASPKSRGGWCRSGPPTFSIRDSRTGTPGLPMSRQ